MCARKKSHPLNAHVLKTSGVHVCSLRWTSTCECAYTQEIQTFLRLHFACKNHIRMRMCTRNPVPICSRRKEIQTFWRAHLICKYHIHMRMCKYTKNPMHIRKGQETRIFLRANLYFEERNADTKVRTHMSAHVHEHQEAISPEKKAGFPIGKSAVFGDTPDGLKAPYAKTRSET